LHCKFPYYKRSRCPVGLTAGSLKSPLPPSRLPLALFESISLVNSRRESSFTQKAFNFCPADKTPQKYTTYPFRTPPVCHLALFDPSPSLALFASLVVVCLPCFRAFLVLAGFHAETACFSLFLFLFALLKACVGVCVLLLCCSVSLHHHSIPPLQTAFQAVFKEGIKRGGETTQHNTRPHTTRQDKTRQP
jgi:hypothetical protein